MANEKFTLTWHSYASHFQGVLGNLFDTGESSDVTLVCDDQVKFKAHKFILKSCSPVFESILNEANESKSVVYLRGVNQLELKPILNFIYSGQASFYQKRMKDFLKIGKDLQIKEIKEMPEEKEEMVDIGENMVDQPHHDVISEEVSSEENESVDENDIARYESRQQERMKEEMVDIGEDMAEKPHHDVISEEVSSDDNESDVDENEIASSTARYESSQEISVPSDSSQCPQCNAVFVYRHHMLRHVRYKQEGVKYPCIQCDFKGTQQSDLKRHIESVHKGVKYPCSQCDYKATKQSHLKRHIGSVHEGVRYPCNQCDHKATTQSHLKVHIKSVHEGMIYPCNQCLHKATTQSHLKVHIRSVHEGMIYPCSQCDYKTIRHTSLKKHIDSKHKC